MLKDGGYCPDRQIKTAQKFSNNERRKIFAKKMKECLFLTSRFLFAVTLFSIAFLSASCGISKDKHLARGEEYLQKRKFQEALMEFRAAAEIDKDSAVAHWGLARSYENLGQYNEAINELQKVKDLNPENLEAKTKLGNYFLAAIPPQTDETQKILDDIFSRDAKYIEGFMLKANLFVAQKKNENEIMDVFNQAIALDENRTNTYISLSRFQMKLEKPAEAEKTIQKGISVSPNLAVGYLEYARFLDFTERSPEAETQFKKAIEVEGNNIEAREMLAAFYVSQRQNEKAEAAYQELVKLQENSPESRLQLADFYASIKREDDAINTLTQIINEKPEYVRARYRLGEIYLTRKEYAKVTEQTDALLKLNNYDSQAFLLLARVNLQDNKTDEAIKNLEEVLKKQPSHKEGLFYMVQARLALGQIDQARAFIGDLEKYHPTYLKTRTLKIQASFQNGETENALRGANELLELLRTAVPTAEETAANLEELQFRALTARGLANLELGKITEARNDLQEVVKTSPNSSAALVNLAKLTAAEKKLPESLELYEKALIADAKNFDALSGAVGILARQKQFPQAHSKIDKAVGENAGNKDVLPALYYLKSDVFTAEKNIESAEVELKKAIELNDEYLPAYSAYASILVNRNQTDAAVEQYKKVVDKKPSASVYTLLGMLEEARNNGAEAEKNYRKALEITPDTPIAANNLAWLIAETNGNLDEALTLAQNAVRKNPNSAGFYDTLGWIYHKKGLKSQAIEQLKKAVMIDERETARTGQKPNPEYRQRLGMASV